MTMVVVASSLTLMTLTMMPMQVDAAPVLITQIDCEEVDDDSDGVCDQDQDRTADNGFNNCIGTFTSGNCLIDQNVAVSDNLRDSTTEAFIHQLVNSYVDCDRGNTFCLARTLNDAEQNVDVKTYRESTTGVRGQIDTQVDQHVTQRIATDGQDRFNSQNFMTQNYFATAIPGTLATSSNTASIDTDGDGVEMYATQENFECDDSNCINDGGQEYNLQANGRSSVVATDPQRLDLNQINDECDDSDSGTVTIDCINQASQVVKLVAGNSGTNNDADVTFDSERNEVNQYNQCRFGQFDCRNVGQTSVDVSAVGTSSINIDDAVLDVDQTNDCDNLNTAIRINNVATTLGCQNLGSVILEADSATDGVINAQGEQNLDQINDCNGASCFNEATLYVGLGSSLLSADNPVDGTLTAIYNQDVDQTNLCQGNAACENELQLAFNAGADGNAIVTAISDQTVIQTNQCIQGQTCLNSLNMANNVFGSGSATVDSTVSQFVEQTCDSTDGPTCLNSDNKFVSATATGGSSLDYFAIQDFQTNDGSNDGTASITYRTDTDPATPFPSSFSSQFRQTTNTQVTNPASNFP